MKSSNYLMQDSWGVASPRQSAGYSSNGKYYAPLGCSRVSWDIQRKDRTLFQIHNDLVSTMIQNADGIILTVAYGGEVKLWSPAFEMIASFQSPTDNIIYGSWSTSGSDFSICSKGPKQMVVVYNLKDILTKTTNVISQKWFFSAPQTETTKNIKNENTKEQKFHDCFNAAIFKENLQVITIYQTSNSCQLFLFSAVGKPLKQSVISPLGEDKNVMLCVSAIQEDLIAIGLQRGVFGFYNVDSLEISTIIQATGSPQVCLWHNETFVTMSYVSGIMSTWDKNGTMLREITGGPTGSIIQMDIADDNSYYIGGIMSLHYVTIKHDETTMHRDYDLSFLTLTGCGVAVRDPGIVASGDFGGNIYFWKHLEHLPVAQLKILSSSPIRCLLWIGNALLIGSLDGELYCWKDESIHERLLKEGKDVVPTGTLDCSRTMKLLYHFLGGVITIHTDGTNKRLAVGTTTGNLYVFSVYNTEVEEFKIEELFHVQVHKPKQQPDGSMLSMEIWSLIWSVGDEFIATTSEDHTTIISDSKTGNVIQTLRGHTTAVTAVDWKILSSGKHVLATCADDKTVRIYDGVTFELLHIVNTYDIYGWHTLTYLCISSKKNIMVVSTQNGYLVTWDLNTYECLAKLKMHSGSIEGLVLTSDEKCVVTIGSDCVVNRFSLVNIGKLI